MFAIRTVTLAAALLVGANGCTNYRPSRLVEPSVPQGLALKSSTAQVEGRVLRELDPGARIERAKILATRDQLWSAIPNSGRPAGRQAHGGPVWLVYAYGHFQLMTVPPGGEQLTHSRSGWIAVDDQTGKRLAYGF